MLKDHPDTITEAEQGFTLIELSIVLVIIGLIVGGVLVGQDLIKAAEVRATISQYEKYNTAVNTFRSKFGGIPGDITSAKAASFGLYAPSTAATAGSTGYGDGNGLVEGGASSTVALIGEPLMFFRHLSDAGLIDGSFGSSTYLSASVATPIVAITTANVANVLPTAKMGRGNYYNVASANGINYFLLGGFGNAAVTTGVYGAQTNNLTPQEAYTIDKKVDDGQPGSGSVQAIDLVAPLAYGGVNIPAPLSAAAGTGSCVISTTPTTYNVSFTTQYCSLRMQFN